VDKTVKFNTKQKIVELPGIHKFWWFIYNVRGLIFRSGFRAVLLPWQNWVDYKLFGKTLATS